MKIYTVQELEKLIKEKGFYAKETISYARKLEKQQNKIDNIMK